MQKIKLRDYQQNADDEIVKAWGHCKNVLLVSPTGSGKTIIVSNRVVNNHDGNVMVIAHRNELISQLSLSLAKNGVYHSFICNNNMIRQIVKLHIKECGHNYYLTTSNTRIASVQTLLARKEKLAHLFNQVSLWIIDEAHHVVKNNQWGKCVDLFPNAKGLGVTATPTRSDGLGLGSHNDGVFDEMVISVDMRTLINQEYLSDYKIYAPPNDLSMDGVRLTGSGDFSAKETESRLESSTVLGDIVEHYLKLANGKIGVTFANSVNNAKILVDEYNAAGVPAKLITGETNIIDRSNLLQQLANREILQLVNVDILGEGVDVPALEVVSFVRPTMSYGLYVQQFGRVVRRSNGKTHGIIIDHVDNVDLHNLPDIPRMWTLDRREKRSAKKIDPDLIPLKTCIKCTGKFQAILKACPYCGDLNKPTERSDIKKIDGDLVELDPDVMALIRGEIDRAMEKINPPSYLDIKIQMRLEKLDNERRELLERVKKLILVYGGFDLSAGFDQSQSHKLFFWRFGVDVMTAQTLKTKESKKLMEKINNYLINRGVKNEK